MANVVVMGAGVGGLPLAYDLKKTLGSGHRVTLISPNEHFQFTPSNPWVAVGWRKSEQIMVPIRQYTEKKGIQFIAQAVSHLDAENNKITLADEQVVDYDYLVISTGPKLAFDEISGLGPQGFTQSICTTPHAEQAWQSYQKFLEKPGPIVIGAVQGASCFGPAYEFAMIVDADLRKKKLRDKVPMTFVTSEPYIGHMGLGGVGDSKGLLEGELRQRHIKWICNAKITDINAQEVKATEHNDSGEALKDHVVPSQFTMFIPAFKGIDPVANVKDMCNPRGFVMVDKHQRNPAFTNIYSAGVCVAIPPVEATPVPTGAPKTGYMIESMVTAIVHNIKDQIAGKEPTHEATWNALCLADLGDTGVAFVAIPQIPPRKN